MTGLAAGSSDGASDVRRVASADGTSLTVELVTSGASTVLMVPGGPSRRARWAEVAARLDGQYACWLMDRRGRGDSGDTEPYSFDREYEDLASVAAALGGEVVVAAHSSGATCALGAALRGAPFAGLVLYEPPWPVDGPLATPEQIDDVEALVAAGDRDAALQLAFVDIVGLPAPVVGMMRRGPVWEEWSTYVHLWPREMRETEKLSRDVSLLAAVEVPTLLLCGGLTDGKLRRATTQIAAALPRASVQELPGQGHGALATAPELVAEAMRAFAAEVAGAAARTAASAARQVAVAPLAGAAGPDSTSRDVSSSRAPMTHAGSAGNMPA